METLEFTSVFSVMMQHLCVPTHSLIWLQFDLSHVILHLERRRAVLHACLGVAPINETVE